MKKSFLLLLCSFFFNALPFPREAFPQHAWLSDAVTATGISSITGGDLPRAQAEAIADAQKKTLVLAVGMLLPFDLFEARFPILKEVLFERASDYIQDYRVLYESTLDDRYHITIQSTVDFKKLEGYLVDTEFISPQVMLPRIVLLVATQKLRQNFYTCWWSFIDPEKEITVIDKVLKEEFQKKGFEVIDHSSLMQEMTVSKVYGCLDLKPETVKSLGTQFKADIAIVGNAQVGVTDKNEKSAKIAVQASMLGRAVKIEDGSTVATLETYFPATAEDDETAQKIALEKVSSSFAQKMGEKISSQWVKESKGVSMITLSISGLSNYLDFSRFKTLLKKEIPEIQNLSQKALTEEGGMLEVESNLSAQSLKELLSSPRFKDFAIAITNVSQSMITMEVTPTAKTQEQPQPATEMKKGAEND